jgi:hypothetical protein
MILSNIHKHPLVSKIMCKLGRHDYEFLFMLDKRTARMECFYCGHRKNSATWIPRSQQ